MCSPIIVSDSCVHCSRLDVAGGVARGLTLARREHAPRALEAVRAAQAAGATTVAITSFAHSPLTEPVDRLALAGTRDVLFGHEGMASRLARLALLDAVLVSVASCDEARSQAALWVCTEMPGDHRL